MVNPPAIDFATSGTAPPPDKMRIMCQACQPPVPLAVSIDQEEVRCSACHTYMRLVTRRVTSANSLQLGPEHVRYQLITEEGEDRSRTRLFTAQPGLRFRPGMWITLVYRGSRLVGIADQTRAVWMSLQELPTRYPGLARFGTALTVFLIVYALAQGTRLATQGSDFITNHGPIALTLTLLIALIALGPILLAVIRSAISFVGLERRYLPWQ